MTESNWMNCTDPQKMLEFLRDKASDRKLRLFACACCRCMWGLLADDAWGRNLVELAERFADGAASLADLETARRLTEAAEEEPSWSYFDSESWATSDPVALPDTATCSKRLRASWTAMATVSSLTQEAAAKASAVFAHPRRWLTERREQAGIIRDVFGNPFLSVTIHPIWLTWKDGTVQKIAQAIYDERAFDRMPILADALEEAGCTNQDILGHCRQPGEHVRGCWVVDLLSGKE
jgi:hypothetical protein